VVQTFSCFRKQHMPGHLLSVKGMFTRADSQLIFLLEFLQTHRTNLERENNKFQWTMFKYKHTYKHLHKIHMSQHAISNKWTDHKNLTSSNPSIFYCRLKPEGGFQKRLWRSRDACGLLWFWVWL